MALHVTKCNVYILIIFYLHLSFEAATFIHIARPRLLILVILIWKLMNIQAVAWPHLLWKKSAPN